MADLAALVADAAAVLDDAVEPYVAGHRADSAVAKKGIDVATEVDLAIERKVVARPPLRRPPLSDSMLGIGTVKVDSRGRLPGRHRLAIFTKLTRACSKIRMHGSTGVDLAFVGAGILGAAISFGHHIRDHAAPVALMRAAGGPVTDLEQIMEILHRVGSSEHYR